MLKLNEKTKKAFHDACEKIGRPESIDFSIFPEDMRDQSEAEYMLKVITEAKNEGWKADWNDPKQEKWISWFAFSTSGITQNGARYGVLDTGAGYSSRLSFSEESIAESAGAELIELYEIALNG